jgi:phosphoglucosamine mutase
MSGLSEKLRAELMPLSFDTIDGVKLNFPDGWLLVRPSGTEPKIRVTAEAKDEQAARDLFKKGAEIITGFIK